MSFVSLHHHTTLSYGDGFKSPEEHVLRCAELEYSAQAVTEHGNVSSHIKHEKAAKAHGIKPIFGVEIYQETGDPRGQLKNHLTVLAATQAGYSNLLGMVSDSWSNFKYQPTTTKEMLAQYAEGLVVMSGCLGGELATATFGGKGIPEKSSPDMAAAGKVVRWFKEHFGDRYYLEIQPHPTLTKQVAYNEVILQLAAKYTVPVVATLDCHYPNASDQDMYPVLHAITRGGRSNTVEGQSQSWEYDILLAPQAPKDIYRGLRGSGLGRRAAHGAMEQTLAIAERCTVEIPKFEDLKYPTDTSGAELLREWARKGWRYRGFHRLRGPERERYLQRVKYELELVLTKGFEDYFLVVSDVVRWAKDHGIPVGPARGSAAASLVCYLLRITEVDPMEFPNLIFERFIDINRHDLPDIDLDFDDEQRWRVRQYLVDKYGAERVGNIRTSVQYKGKNSLEAIGRVYKIPFGDIEAVKEMIIERSSGDLRGNATLEDSREMFPKVAEVFKRHPKLLQAERLEGNEKGMSVHAAGLVIANEPLTRGMAVYTRTDSKNGERASVLSIDKYDADYLNALKLDALGLTTMGMIRRCLEMVGMTLEELYAVSRDEEAVYEAFRRNEVIGVFQFDGRAMRSVNREVKPDNFAEICDINALARPGPLHSGAAAEYIQVKHGRKKAEFLHDTVSAITAHTNQQIVYQEQILRVVRELGNFTWEEAATIRKLISKKQGEQAFNRMQQLFVTGCASNGVKPAVVLRIWKLLVTAGAYAFNAAHCVSYGMLAYWTMWLKVNHPLEFYCAALQKYDPKTKGFDLLKEAAAKGITILPPHPVRSQATWSVDRRRKGLRAGFTQITGIGEKTATAMVEFRTAYRAGQSSSSRMDWMDYTAVSGIGPATMAKVVEFVAQEDPFGIDLLSKTLTAMRDRLWREGDSYGVPFPRSKSEDVPYEPKKGEHVWLGTVKERNLKDLYELHRSRTGEELDPAKVTEPNHINWCVVTGEDETGPLTITVHRFRGLYEKYKDRLWGLDPKRHLLLVRGYKKSEYRRALYAEQVWVIDPETMEIM
jgi:DNA polymerase-3 subunit alpha